MNPINDAQQWDVATQLSPTKPAFQLSVTDKKLTSLSTFILSIHAIHGGFIS